MPPRVSENQKDATIFDSPKFKASINQSLEDQIRHQYGASKIEARSLKLVPS
jgi:hypothetical protein